MLALWVVLHHLTGKGMMLESWILGLPEEARLIVRGGYLAVSTFFVLSGFVLALSYRQSSWTRTGLMRYGFARLARVYPTYLLSLVLITPFIAEYVFNLTQDKPAASTKVLMVAHYWFVSQGWAGKLPVSWNTPAWSLSCELFFYVCFPLLVAAIGSRAWPKMVLVAGIALSIPTVLADFGVSWSLKPLYHMADFLLGIALAGIYEAVSRRGWADRIAGFWLYVPASVLGLLFIASPRLVERSMTLSGALRPVNAALLMGLALGGGFPAKVLSTRAAVYLGKASYSLYILHIPLLWWFKRTWLYTSGYIPQGLLALIYVAAAITLSGVACSYFEEPANRRIRGWAAGRFEHGRD